MQLSVRFLILGGLVSVLGLALAGCSTPGDPTVTGPKPDAQSSVAATNVPDAQRGVAKLAAQKQAEMNAMRERDAAKAKAQAPQ